MTIILKNLMKMVFKFELIKFNLDVYIFYLQTGI
jgi:hypothetical protein